jgi:hypothetical protein
VTLREEVVREIVLVAPEAAPSRAVSAVASLAQEVVSRPPPRAGRSRR